MGDCRFCFVGAVSVGYGGLLASCCLCVWRLVGAIPRQVENLALMGAVHWRDNLAGAIRDRFWGTNPFQWVLVQLALRL